MGLDRISNRRWARIGVFQLLATWSLLFLGPTTSSSHLIIKPDPVPLYVVSSGYSDKWIVYRLDEKSGDLSPAAEVAQDGAANVSYGVFSPEFESFYTVQELNGVEGMVARWSIRKGSGSGDPPVIRKEEEFPTGGVGPCHVAVDVKASVLYVANYLGSFSAFRLDRLKGNILGRVYLEELGEGSNAVPDRQAESHPHQVVVYKDHVYVVDLGSDLIRPYKVHSPEGLATNSSIELTKVPPVKTKPGYLPRHMVANPSTKTMYVIHEQQPFVGIYSVDEGSGQLTFLQEVPTVPQEWLVSGVEQYGSEIELHPNRKWLYASNRGTGAILVYAIAQDTGLLTQIQVKETVGSWPRHFSFGLGRVDWTMNVAQERDNILEVYNVSHETGMLSDIAQQVASDNKPALVASLF